MPVYLFVSSTLDESLNPGDYVPMLDADSDAIFAEDEPADLEWRGLAEEHAGVVRLTVSTEASSVGWNGGAFASPFAVSVQASS